MPGDFVDLIAWQQAVQLAANVSRLVGRIRGPGGFAVADQMRRAAEGVPANIAEGYGRGLGADFARFLRVAAGSAAELESHLRVAVAAARLRPVEADESIALCRRVRALLRGLEHSVKGRAPSRSSTPPSPLTLAPITHHQHAFDLAFSPVYLSRRVKKNLPPPSTRRGPHVQREVPA